MTPSSDLPLLFDPIPTSTLSGRVVAGRYRVVGRVGQGGIGRVYLAEQRGLDRRVALKVIRPERRSDPVTAARFEREARAVGRISSPHVVTTYDSGRDERGDLYIAMELLEGESLADRMRSGPELTVLEATTIAAAIAKGLRAAHEAGVLHRDLKPANVFLCADGNVKVLDFGIAKLLDEQPADALTSVHRILGTPVYMSPEAARRLPLGPTTDLYALGVLLFEMIAGQPPFKTGDARRTLRAHLTTPAPPPARGRALAARPERARGARRLAAREGSLAPAARRGRGRSAARADRARALGRGHRARAARGPSDADTRAGRRRRRGAHHGVDGARRSPGARAGAAARPAQRPLGARLAPTGLHRRRGGRARRAGLRRGLRAAPRRMIGQRAGEVSASQARSSRSARALPATSSNPRSRCQRARSSLGATSHEGSRSATSARESAMVPARATWTAGLDGSALESSRSATSRLSARSESSRGQACRAAVAASHASTAAWTCTSSTVRKGRT
ncbi:MAG: serine/threonine protein kinase [Sandaracinaceae bacterium]|nr:serine/threonine protein kinase [Sandaracinaceae bacterium]